jgi:excinuclease ABC subunit A
LKGLKEIDKVIEIDQSPIGRTPRSNPVTYIKVFDEIRKLYAMLPEAKIRGYAAGRFSFNVKGGRCEECGGGGMKIIEMNFLPDVEVQCEKCFGKRYNRETLRSSLQRKINQRCAEHDRRRLFRIFRKHSEHLSKTENTE